MRGCVELNTLVQNVDPNAFSSVPQHPIGLAKLCEMFIFRHLRKDKRVRASNWEAALSADQILCMVHPKTRLSGPDKLITDAANDAACSLAIFYEMKIRVSIGDYDSAIGEFSVVDGSLVQEQV